MYSWHLGIYDNQNIMCFLSVILTALTIKSTIFRDVKTCNPVKVRRRFGGMYWLRLRGSSEPNTGF
jgi:hypothetical protein